jgi:hypothetical protein
MSSFKRTKETWVSHVSKKTNLVYPERLCELNHFSRYPKSGEAVILTCGPDGDVSQWEEARNISVIQKLFHTYQLFSLTEHVLIRTHVTNTVVAEPQAVDT